MLYFSLLKIQERSSWIQEIISILHKLFQEIEKEEKPANVVKSNVKTGQGQGKKNTQ